MTPFHVELDEANAFVNALHRHHKPVVGHRFSVGAWHNHNLVGVAIVGRPVARKDNQYTTVEVLRNCTDGTKNACSFLYGLSARIAEQLGYELIQTFILASEPGTSLIASGWVCVGETRGGDWNVPSRGGRRVDQPQGPKTKWQKQLGGNPPATRIQKHVPDGMFPRR